MVERLLCKQEVVGSIPSASRARSVGLEELGTLVEAHAGCGVLAWVSGTACGGFAIARGFVVLDCESGSGASLDAQGNSVVFWYHFGGVGAWLGAVRAVALC